MADKILKKSDFNGFIKSLAGRYEVLGPVEADGVIKYAPAGPEEFKLDFTNSHLSPKNLFFPQSERMFEFDADRKAEGAFILKELPEPDDPRLVFGLRPCDAKAFFVLDKIFKNDQYEDPYWFQKRNRTVLIGLGCDAPCPTCFCTSVNCGPFHEEGLDALAYDLGDGFLIKTLSEKGQKALGQAQGLSEAKAQDLSSAAALKDKAEAALADRIHLDKIAGRTVLELFQAGHWDYLHETCINCGTCTYCCPTCHCFDIQDEAAGRDGDRLRNWDTCMSWLFTMHGSGHNPRPTKKERVRQRFMHKFKYIPLKRGGEIGCVGCGRCVNFCPVNIDVRDVVRDMNA
ncbi:MAG: 4Fe-4S dicluster domain-containing protein [Thermodesulfobacteriota bacterium]